MQLLPLMFYKNGTHMYDKDFWRTFLDVSNECLMHIHTDTAIQLVDHIFCATLVVFGLGII